MLKPRQSFRITLYVSICKRVQLIANFNTLEREGSQYERLIAQQYSSAHIRLIALHFRKEIAGARLHFFIFLIFLLFENILSLKLRILELRFSGNVCNCSHLQILGVDNSCQTTMYSEEGDGMTKLQRILVRFLPGLT